MNVSLDEAAAEPRPSGCPVMALVRYVLALAAAVCPRPPPGALRRGSSARTQAHPAKQAAGACSARCPFLRLLVLVGMQVVASSALQPPSHRAAPHVRRVASGRGAALTASSALGSPTGAPPNEHGPRGKRVLILGGGWVGSRAANHIAQLGAEVTVTYRDLGGLSAKPAYFQPVELSAAVGRTRFELECRESWDNLPPPEELSDVIVTFPFAEAAAALAFHERYLCRARNVVLCSSTSIYQVAHPHALVTEETPLKPDTARGHAEEGLRKRGATLLALGGIFGDQAAADASPHPSERTVCASLAMYTAQTPASSAAKLINMVHVDDILATLSACLRTPQPGARVNVVGCTVALRDLAAQCGLPSGASVDASLPADTSSKRICNAKLTKLLPPDHRFRTPLEPPCAEEDCAPGTAALHVAQAA